MSEFKDRLKMFDVGNGPPMMPKPKRKDSEVQSKPQSPLINNDKKVTVSDVSNKDELDSSVYRFCDSLYDLPGFENFIIDIKDAPATKTQFPIDDPAPDESPKYPTLQSEVTSSIDNDHVHIAPSQNLIDEIFKTSIWRNSENFADDFIYAPPRISVPTTLPCHNDQRLLPPDDKINTPARRSLFDTIFRSKRGQKKSTEKLHLKDNSDSDKFPESPSKKKSNSKKQFENQTNSLDRPKMKPLNSMFDRDWLNNIGDGVTKKATVMSELKKLFSHGRFKNFKKKTEKSSSAPKTEISKKKKDNKKKVIDDVIYDEDVEEELNTVVEKTKTDDKSDTNSIYDDGEEVEEVSNVAKHVRESFFSKQRHDYDGPKDIAEIYASEEEVVEETPIVKITQNQSRTQIISCNDSIYDEGDEEEEALKPQLNEKDSVNNSVTSKSPGKPRVEKKKSNAFMQIFSPISSNPSLSNEKGDIVQKKGAREDGGIHFDKDKMLDKDAKGNDKTNEATDKIIEIANKINKIKTNESKEIMGQGDVYDDEVEDVDEKIHNLDDQRNVKERGEERKTVVNERPDVKKEAFSKKIIGKEVKKINKQNNFSKNKILISDVYDEDVEEVEEYVSDVDDNLVIVESEKVKDDTVKGNQGKRKEILSKKLAGIQKSRVGVKNIFSKVVKTQSDIYDEDVEEVEEYAGDVEDYIGNKDQVEHVNDTGIEWPKNNKSNITKNKENHNKNFKDESIKEEEKLKRGVVNENQWKINEILSKKLMEKSNKKIKNTKNVKTQLDEYDEDDEGVEDDTVDKDKKFTSKDVNVELKKVNPTKSSEKWNPSRANNLLPKLESKQSNQRDQDSIYDDEDEPIVDNVDKKIDCIRKMDDIDSNKCDEREDFVKNKNKILNYLPLMAVTKKTNEDTRGAIGVAKGYNNKEKSNLTHSIVEEHKRKMSADAYDEDETSQHGEVNWASLKSKNKNVVKAKAPSVNKPNADLKKGSTRWLTSSKTTAALHGENLKSHNQNNEVNNCGDIYDIDDEEAVKLVGNSELPVEKTFEAEDEALQKLIKRNLKVAKKTFKLKEPILPIAIARAIKTVYLESKMNIPFNIGEHLEIIEYRNDMALVKNGVGKCGLTSTSNLQVIKNP